MLVRAQRRTWPQRGQGVRPRRTWTEEVQAEAGRVEEGLAVAREVAATAVETAVAAMEAEATEEGAAHEF